MSEKWTTEKPTEAGIYKVWYSPMDECDVVRIALHKGVPFIAADLDDSATIQAYTHFKRIDLTPPEGETISGCPVCGEHHERELE